MNNSLLILSGGMDSVTLLNQFKDQIELCVTFNYGSKHNNKEQISAKYFCNKLGKKHIVIDLEFVNKYFKSDLLQAGGEIPDGHYADYIMKKTVVPYRNGIMLSIAAGIAESNDLKYISIANHFGDHAIYPDCRTEFIKTISKAIKLGTYKQCEIQSPYSDISKRDIALIGKDLNIEYEKTWSCYKGKTIHCGTCGTCVERKEALSGFDKTKYLN